MTDKTSDNLDRKELFRRMEHLHCDANNYKVYVSEESNPELYRKIMKGEVTVTLQDLIDAGFDPRKLSV